MTLWNTDSLTIEAASASESLPDPTTVGGRTHQLVNNSNVTQTWTSVGATPFVVGGVNSANLVLAVGQSARLYSNGTRWVVVGGPGSRRMIALTGVTNASGDAVFNLTPAGFAVAPVVQAAVQAADSSSPLDYRITALSATSVTIRVRSSPATVIALLGLTLLGASVVAPGITVHMYATEAGATP